MEQWFVTNNTSRPVSIGDLPRVPTVEPQKTVDLLQYVSKQEIANSEVLSALLSANILAVNKQKILP